MRADHSPDRLRGGGQRGAAPPSQAYEEFSQIQRAWTSSTVLGIQGGELTMDKVTRLYAEGFGRH